MEEEAEDGGEEGQGGREGQRSEVRQGNLASGAATSLSAARAGRTPYRPSGEATSSSLQQKDESGAERHVQSSTLTFNSVADTSATGEELFNQARALPHQPIPDFDNDAEYPDLLGKSAAAGYAPALVKLGEYAMRRAAWVEAYYWMKLAQRNGMHGLSPTMREIRKNWSLHGFPNQSSNVNMLFTVEAGSVGRALLHVDSGHEASKAREFLKAIHPEFLT